MFLRTCIVGLVALSALGSTPVALAQRANATRVGPRVEARIRSALRSNHPAGTVAGLRAFRLDGSPRSNERRILVQTGDQHGLRYLRVVLENRRDGGLRVLPGGPKDRSERAARELGRRYAYFDHLVARRANGGRGAQSNRVNVSLRHRDYPLAMGYVDLDAVTHRVVGRSKPLRSAMPGD